MTTIDSLPGLIGDSVRMTSDEQGFKRGEIVKIVSYPEIYYGPTSRRERANGVWQSYSHVAVQRVGDKPVWLAIWDVEPLPGCLRKLTTEKRLRDLPPTPLWEGDIVSTTDGKMAKVLKAYPVRTGINDI
jgi:hypothetical protein